MTIDTVSVNTSSKSSTEKKHDCNCEGFSEEDKGGASVFSNIIEDTITEKNTTDANTLDKSSENKELNGNNPPEDGNSLPFSDRLTDVTSDTKDINNLYPINTVPIETNKQELQKNVDSLKSHFSSADDSAVLENILLTSKSSGKVLEQTQVSATDNIAEELSYSHSLKNITSDVLDSVPINLKSDIKPAVADNLDFSVLSLKQLSNITEAPNTLLSNTNSQEYSLSAFQKLDSSGFSLSSVDKSLQINQPVLDEFVEQKISWMFNKGLKSAEIQLDPPELGKLNVHLKVNNEQVTVNFVVQNAAVKEALDASVLRLKEMFTENNMNLLDVNVSQQGDTAPQQQGHDASSSPQAIVQSAGELNENAIGNTGIIKLASEGLVDAYA